MIVFGYDIQSQTLKRRKLLLLNHKANLILQNLWNYQFDICFNINHIKLLSKNCMNPQRQQQCLVCGQLKSELYSFAQCSHKFCLQCCEAYVQQKSNSFQSIRCMYQGCKQPFDKSTVVYMKLPRKIKQKIQKLQRLIFLQKNPNLKACASPDCNGLFDINLKKAKQSLKCDVAQHQNCSKCFQVFHLGECNFEVDADMEKLHYKKCPKCRIWVQKKDGCDFISCKCGTVFCFGCGIQFSKDPCRKRQLWLKQENTRAYLKQIKFRKPESVLGYVIFFPKVLLQTLLVVILTICFTIFPMVFGLLALILFAVLVCPLGICACAQDPTFRDKKCCIRWMVFLLYPLLMGLCGIAAIIGCIFYPILRNTYHHGVYDPLDNIVYTISNAYLYLLVGIFQY